MRISRALPVITWEKNPRCPPPNALQDHPPAALVCREPGWTLLGHQGAQESGRRPKTTESDWKLWLKPGVAFPECWRPDNGLNGQPARARLMAYLARATPEINYQSFLIILKWHLLIHKAWGNTCVGGCSPGRSEESERRPDTWARLGAASPGPAPGHGHSDNPAAVNPPEKPHPERVPGLGQGCTWHVLLHNQQEGLGQEEQVLTWRAPSPPRHTWPGRAQGTGLQVLKSALEKQPGVRTHGDLAKPWSDKGPRPAPLSPSLPISVHHPARLTGAALSAQDARRKAHRTSPAPGVSRWTRNSWPPAPAQGGRGSLSPGACGPGTQHGAWQVGGAPQRLVS